ncbi:hypothetical protein [Microcoleus sp. herbarium14]|uniref:hypothetical protein n=1 Tax=Microcoleus sp. herbarium14 TaxID=3055439 RepID=UPI002FD41757
MSNTVVICPDYIRILERKLGGWALKKGDIFYNPLPFAVDFQDFELHYGISKQQVVTELFRLNGGKVGYYLADLRHKQYYYCGKSFEDVKTMLVQMGIGRAGLD